MLMFPFNSPSHSTFTHGESGSAYTKPLLDEPLLLTSSNVFGRSTFLGSAHFVMILLKATGAYHFLQSSVKDTANMVYTFNDLGLLKHFDELQDRLWSVRTPPEAVHLIDHSLIQYLGAKARVGAGDFAPVMEHMMRYPAALQVRDLARKFKCSERWVEKQCAT